MNKLTIESAFELRESLKSREYTYAERQVIREMLIGTYDKYKNEKLDIAKEDIEFLTEQSKVN